MKQCWFRFYASLNDFLPPERKQVEFLHDFELDSSLKDMIEALGVPHTEIDLVLVNGISSSFKHLLRGGERVSAFPWFHSLLPDSTERLRPPPLLEPRFACDVHLGRLSAYLRMLGFDTFYRNDCPDDQLATIAVQERRILLTRDRGLLKRTMVVHGCFVRASDARIQIQEVIGHYNLSNRISLFTRCMNCNAALQPVRKEEVLDRLPPRTSQCYDDFRLCPGCGKIYWKGSHYRRMRQLIATLIVPENLP